LRAVVNAVMNLRVPKIRGISWVDDGLLASQKGLFCMKLVKQTYGQTAYFCLSRSQLAVLLALFVYVRWGRGHMHPATQSCLRGCICTEWAPAVVGRRQACCVLWIAGCGFTESGPRAAYCYVFSRMNWIHFTIVWDVTPCSLVDTCSHFIEI
jgi:hypothetical protein